MILLGATQATSVRMRTPYAGAWTADIELTGVSTLPSGQQILIIGTDEWIGTVDPNASGVKGELATVRLVGGGGGWDKEVPSLYFANDAQVFSTVVFAATAAEVGEVVVEAAVPKQLGAGYTRMMGPASRVLPPGGWYVTPQGITIVGPRVPVPMLPDVTIIDWDPLSQVAELATEHVIAPGTILVDPIKFGAATVTVRDVEQSWDESGVRVRAYCNSENASSRLVSALAKFAREAAGAHKATAYAYRVVLPNPDGRLVLQAVDPSRGAPDMLPISIWPGLPGAQVKPTPGSLCMVEFQGGDVSKPIVRSFDGAPALEVTIAAATSFGIIAPLIEIAGVLSPASGPLVIGLPAGTPKPVAIAAPIADILAKMGAAFASLVDASGCTGAQRAAIATALGNLSQASSLTLAVTG